jgi:hypothetical protein
MTVGQSLLDLAGAADSVFVVGIGKNVGKTVTARAIYEAAHAAGVRTGITSIGRDGEPSDAGDARPKPRLFLRPGTVVATARGVLPRSPACEMLGVSSLQTAAGPVVYARVVHAAYFELVGPPTASGMREVVAGLRAHAKLTIVDGAIDRVAATAGSSGAIVVAAGASAAATPPEAVDAIRALVLRLGVARYDEREEAVRVDGALTASRAAALIAARDSRQIVVRDPTQIALSGRAALNAFARLRIRCERPLRPIAATIASIAAERSFEPRAFARAVAEATQLPTFDVYAGKGAA